MNKTIKKIITLYSFVERKDLLVISILTLIYNLSLFAPILYMLQVFDRVLMSGNYWTLFFCTSFFLVSIVIGYASEYLRRIKFLECLKKFEISQVENSKSLNEENKENGLLSYLSKFKSLRAFLASENQFAIFDVWFVFLYSFAIYLIYSELILWALALVIPTFLINFYQRSYNEKYGDDYGLKELEERKKNKNKFRYVLDLFVMGFINNDGDVSRKSSAIKEDAKRRFEDVKFDFYILLKVWKSLQQSLFLAIGAYYVIDGAISPASMIAANMLMAKIINPIEAFNSFIFHVKNASDSLDLFEKKSENKNELHDEYKVEDYKEFLIDSIRIKNLSVKGISGKILSDINLNIGNASVVTIIGSSASGKSTLLKCLAGLKNFDGDILFGNKDSRLLNRDGIIGYQSQDNEIYPGSISENISSFRDLNSAAIVKAAQDVGLHEKIVSLEKGYDTYISKGSNILSSGQLQQLCLARAVFNYPRIIILDEPNSRMDSFAENKLCELLIDLKNKGCKIILSAHRNSTAKISDLIVLLEDGSIQSIVNKNEEIY